LALAAVLLPFFVMGGWLNPLDTGPRSITNLTRGVAGPYEQKFAVYDPYRVPRLAPAGGSPLTADPARQNPGAARARAEAIRRSADAIRGECAHAARGDWQNWQRDTERYRAQLFARIVALTDAAHAELPRSGDEVLEGSGGFPLFEIYSRQYLNYLYEPGTLDLFRCERPVVAADRWLRGQGIDLIFVPVPKMTEVYVEHFVDPCPADGIIAPHVRQTLLELLEADVEVVDGWRLFRPLREDGTEYLYNTADPHWAPRAMRIMAKEIADRIGRYTFAARARFAAPIVQTSPGPYHFTDNTATFDGYGKEFLRPEQYARAKKAQTTTLSEVRLLNGQVPPDDPASPVMVIGNSYVPKFREQLIKELNLLTCTRAADHQSTQCFADFVRQPELLEHCRVIVWITTDQQMTQFYPLPPPVAAAQSGE
jgi:hypothetical protein